MQQRTTSYLTFLSRLCRFVNSIMLWFKCYSGCKNVFKDSLDLFVFLIALAPFHGHLICLLKILHFRRLIHLFPFCSHRFTSFLFVHFRYFTKHYWDSFAKICIIPSNVYGFDSGSEMKINLSISYIRDGNFVKCSKESWLRNFCMFLSCTRDIYNYIVI